MQKYRKIRRICKNCGELFIPTGTYQKLCEKCQIKVNKEWADKKFNKKNKYYQNIIKKAKDLNLEI